MATNCGLGLNLMSMIALLVTGSKQKWVPISIELPKSSRARRNWPPRRDQPPETGRESSGAKDDTAHSRHRDDGQAASWKTDGFPRKDRRDRRDVLDQGGKELDRPNSATQKASAVPSKKG